MGGQCLREAVTCLVGAASQPGRFGLGFAGLHFSPPEGGLWALQDKEGVGHETSLRLLNLERAGIQVRAKPTGAGVQTLRGLDL